MFERFTERARRVIVLAQEEARVRDHDYIGTEHILLGLIRDGDEVTTAVLEPLGTSPDGVRRQVDQIIGRGKRPPSGHIPFTPRAKNVLGLARREADDLGSQFIGTVHLLLGLIRERDGVAGQVLVSLGADLSRVRQQAGARLQDDALAPVDSLDRRLEAIERWVGMRPDLEDLDQQIAQARREKEAAIESQDFDAAVAARDKETQLLATRTGPASRPGPEGPAGAGAGRLSLADELRRVSAELERLRAILREHGIGPDNDAA
jgi:ATP-dependent Clp protease ATP-binding subunit ClpA